MATCNAHASRTRRDGGAIRPGTRGETGIRGVVDFEGHVVTWFPVRP